MGLLTTVLGGGALGLGGSKKKASSPSKKDLSAALTADDAKIAALQSQLDQKKTPDAKPAAAVGGGVGFVPVLLMIVGLVFLVVFFMAGKKFEL